MKTLSFKFGPLHKWQFLLEKKRCLKNGISRYGGGPATDKKSYWKDIDGSPSVCLDPEETLSDLAKRLLRIKGTEEMSDSKRGRAPEDIYPLY